MRSIRTFAALGAVAALALAACGDDDSSSDTSAPAVTAAPGDSTGSTGDLGSITVGSANFPESQLLAEIYAQALTAAGADVSTELNIGSREVYFAAIESGEIDLLPEYTNALLSYTLRLDDPNASPDATNVTEQVTALNAALEPKGLEVLEPSTAEDKDVIVCRADVAEQYDLANLSDLAAVADQITLGAPPEFETRAPFGLVGFEDIFGATFKEFVPLQIGAIADALKGGTIDCGNLFSTMSVITTEGFVALEDDKTIVPNEAVVPLIRIDVANPAVVEVLNQVSSVLTTENLKAMMVKVEVDATDPASVATEFLQQQGIVS